MIDRLAMMIRQVRDEAKAYARQRAASIVRFAQVTANTASGDHDKVQGHETEPDETSGGYQYTVRRLWPFGIRSRPPTNVDAVVVHAYGGPTNGIMVGAESAEYGPGDLEEGEVAIYCKQSGTVIRLWASGGNAGKITIDAGNSKDVVVNGGNAAVARVGDDVNSTGGFNLWLTNVKLQIIAAGGGDIGNPPSHIGDIATGAARFKG